MFFLLVEETETYGAACFLHRHNKNIASVSMNLVLLFDRSGMPALLERSEAEFSQWHTSAQLPLGHATVP